MSLGPQVTSAGREEVAGGVVGSGEFGSGWQILPARQAGLGGHGDLLPS